MVETNSKKTKSKKGTSLKTEISIKINSKKITANKIDYLKKALPFIKVLSVSALTALTIYAYDIYKNAQFKKEKQELDDMIGVLRQELDKNYFEMNP